MQTPSHFLMTAALAKALPKVPIVKSAFLWGSVAPDLALRGLSIGGVIYYHFMLGWSMEQTSTLMFEHLYFHHPVWIISHNLLYAPILLLLGLGWAWHSHHGAGSQASRWFLWFFLACLMHSIVDILTHVDDGSLVFFPFNWMTRFRSVVSYYDNRYYGREFSLFERSLNLFFLIYLLYSPAYRYLRKLVQKL